MLLASQRASCGGSAIHAAAAYPYFAQCRQKRVSKLLCDRPRVRPQSARAAICQRAVTTDSPSGALSLSRCS
jgi:hypothetical protein